MENRTPHRQELLGFLQAHFSGHRWQLRLPSSGRGHESYIAQNEGECYFVKLGADVKKYEVMASLGLTPPVIQAGFLDDGTPVMVQTKINGRNPSWFDFRSHLEEIAPIVNKAHHSLALKNVLPDAPSSYYKDAGLAAITRVQQKWELYRPLVPAEADYVDQTFALLKQAVKSFDGHGLVASHNDICNANWLIGSDGKIYLVDLEAMSLDDPAHDMGSLLWWYYPPELRQRFLEIAGHPTDEAFKNRMRLRMALHCLDIILPRRGSFDRFVADTFGESLVDFRAAVEGEENPRGYGDA